MSLKEIIDTVPTFRGAEEKEKFFYSSRSINFKVDKSSKGIRDNGYG